MTPRDREVEFLALVTDPENPVDVATAYAATNDNDGSSEEKPSNFAQIAGVIAALIVVLLAIYLLS
jgi:hypothetical protein